MKNSFLIILILNFTACLDWPEQICGNGIHEVGELCEDGNTVSGDGCSADCISDETCGNEIIDTQRGEQCDDGNRVDGDGCSANCNSDETCGNNVTDKTIGEVCDDGNTADNDGCSADCRSHESCGNDIIDREVGEVCDDGNNTDGDGCSANCRSDETCGNETTDETVGEVCDDGNTVDGDGCSANCRSDESCGNRIIDQAAGEVCDDGNRDDEDSCSANCRIFCPEKAEGLVFRNEDSCYLLGRSTASWGDGVHFCEDRGMHLVTLNNQAEIEMLRDELDRVVKDKYSLSMWIGLHDINNEGEYEWLSEVSLPENYTFLPEEWGWYTGNPDNALEGEDCFAVWRSNNNLIDHGCAGGGLHIDVCEIEAGTIHQICGNGHVEGTEKCDDGNRHDSWERDEYVVDTCNEVCQRNCEIEESEDVSNFKLNCYHIGPETLAFEAAQEYCEGLSMHLATITNDEENQFVSAFRNHVTRNGQTVPPVWIGLTDEAEEGTWLWINGESNHPELDQYQEIMDNWSPSPNTNPPANCCVIPSDVIRWQAEMCNSPHYYPLCES